MVVPASHREGSRRWGSRVLGLLEGPQRLNGACEYRSVLLQPVDALVPHRHRSAEALGQRLEVRGAA